MTISKEFWSVLAIASLVTAAVVASPFVSRAASNPTVEVLETVANVTAGTNNQTVATTSTTANVAEVKAQRIVDVTSAPTNTNTILIGTCTVTFATTTAGSPSQDLSCASDSAARITTATTSGDVAKTAVQIAADLARLTGATSTGHGGITAAAGTTTTKVTFTTTGTEASATSIAFTDGTSGKIISTGDTAGVIPVAQVWALTPANVESGDGFYLTLNGTTIAATSTDATVANITGLLTTAINASAQASAVTASDQTTRVDITSDTAGTAFTISTTTARNRAAAQQTVTFTPTNVGSGDTVHITVGSSTVNIVVGSGVQETVEAIVAALAGNGAATCTEDDVKVTCVAYVAGTSFTYSGSVSEASHSSGGGGGGGGRSSGGSSHSSSSSSSTSDLQAMITTLKAKLAELMAKANGTGAVAAASGNAVFNRDLDAGATGADVKSLQVYLNAHGFAVAATGAGSVGNETMLFGPATKAALAKFQAAKGIMPAAGFFGPKTRAYITANP